PRGHTSPVVGLGGSGPHASNPLFRVTVSGSECGPAASCWGTMTRRAEGGGPGAENGAPQEQLIAALRCRVITMQSGEACCWRTRRRSPDQVASNVGCASRTLSQYAAWAQVRQVPPYSQHSWE